nr:MAG: ORF1 [TTV-like mini virus]
MPYYWRPWYRRRRRRLWRWRARKTFRRRYRRRRPRVRRFKRKLKRIHVTQWQPSTINKLKIRGEYPLFQGTRDRTTNNLNQYLTSIAPTRFPGGGLWSIARFSLYSLYELHRKARNWWTKSNCKLPLVKYLGCRVKLFRSLTTDYIFVYSTCGDMEANLETYQSAQPSILNLNKHKVIVTCDNGVRQKKPYKKLFIKPPALFENKWYFQRDIAKLPLFMTITAAASLNRWYVDSKAESNTMGFVSLNTEFFKYHNFRDPPLATGYTPNDEFTLWTLPNGVHLENAKWGNLIYLGNSKDWTGGLSINEMKGNQQTQPDKGKVQEYFEKITNWGNPFYSPYFHPEYPEYLTTNKGLDWVKAEAKKNLDSAVTGFTRLSQDLYWECRYNPEADMSHNGVYITQIYGPRRPWENPVQQNLKTEGLPLWLLLHGFTDYHAKAGDVQQLMTDNIIVISSDYITPARKDYYVPIDREFLAGHSPYETDIRKPFDELYWYPKLNFQQRTLNEIVTTGPGTPKLPKDINAEAKMEYQFLFKLGGCPPPMDEVCDPLTRSKFPTPSNLVSSTLLQNPETPIEYYLHAFDERRGLLTERAAKRIKKDKDFTETLLDFAGQTSTEVPTRTRETSSEETSEEEKDQETIQLDIQHQRRKQRKLRHRILKLLKLAESI